MRKHSGNNSDGGGYGVSSQSLSLFVAYLPRQIGNTSGRKQRCAREKKPLG
jgi:hypothetical protein